MAKHSIEVDDEVFQFLQKHARPLVDSPNDVLRRLFLSVPDQSKGSKFMAAQAESYPTPDSPQPPRAVDGFVRRIVSTEFGVGFRRAGRYRLMFQDGDRLIYFQNFNKKGAPHLWYRITADPWRDLKSKAKTAWICLTNPAEWYAYLIPVADIIERVHRSGWSKSHLEVNIDPGTSRWTELDWDLSEYRKVYRRGA